jgi:hypothetical protein
MLKNAALVFHLQDGKTLREQRLALVLLGILFLVILLTFWLVLQFSFEELAKIDWSAVWKKTSSKPGALVELALRGVLPLVILLGLYAHKKNARLTLDDNELKYTSGIPLIGRWLD